VAHRLSQDGLAVAVVDQDEPGAQTVAASIANAGGRAMGGAADASASDEVAVAVTSVCAELGNRPFADERYGQVSGQVLYVAGGPKA
jgi:hypothetical protein